MRIKILFLYFFIPVFFFGQPCDSLLLESITNPGPYLVSNIDESDGLRDGPDYYEATIYYPQNISSFLPSIIFVPGHSNTQFTIQNWGWFLASHGIVTMTIGTNTLFDTHTQRRDALLDALITLKLENERIGSPLFGNIDTSRMAVGGFSKGGGGAQLAAVADSDLKAVIALYPWLENPALIDLSHSVPVLIASGEIDIIAPPSVHANIHYNYTPATTTKLLYEIQNATHDPLIGPYAGNGDLGIMVLSWLQTYLLEDTCYCPILLTPPNTSSSYMTNIDCDVMPLENSQFINEETKLKYTLDILGRKTERRKNHIFFLIYENGKVEKRIIVD